MTAAKQGFIQSFHGKIWYKKVGERNKTPLIVIHGGPGYPHNYLKPLEDISDEQPVIFYDQLGCGKSKHPDNPNLWTVEYFREELQSVIKSLKLERYHLLGHSWGAALAAEAALHNFEGLKSITLADPYVSSPLWMKDAERLLKQLSEQTQQDLKQSPDSEAFKQASDTYYEKFVYRMDEKPKESKNADKAMNRKIYETMWGIKEFEVTGTLKSYDLLPELHKITIPTLLVCGRYDEATPEALEALQKEIPNAEARVFENSAHFPFWTDRMAFIDTLRTFLMTND